MNAFDRSRGRARRIALASLLAGAAIIPSPGGEALAQARPTRPTSEGVVNLNEASVGQLVLLPGIGHTKAERIVAYRKRRRFRATRELIRVRGIGRRTFHRLKPYLTIKGPTTLTRKVKRERRKR